MFGFLCGTALTGPRSLFAFARSGLAPAPLGRVHPTRRTPHVAIIVYAGTAAALALTGSFEQLLVLTNVSGLLVYVGVALAAWELRRRDVRTHGDPFRAPGGALAPVLSCLTIGGVIVAMATWVEIAAVAGAIALTVGGWWLVAGRDHRP
jgi:amino acid transporter